MQGKFSAAQPDQAKRHSDLIAELVARLNVPLLAKPEPPRESRRLRCVSYAAKRNSESCW